VHEYLTSYGRGSSQYKKCLDCDKSTPHICLRCNCCYSCHFKIERIEKEHWRKQGNDYLVIFTTYTIGNNGKWVQPPMGRTIPSFRIASVMEEMEWKSFRNSLDKSDRKKFDQMFSLAHLYNSASREFHVH